MNLRAFAVFGLLLSCRRTEPAVAVADAAAVPLSVDAAADARREVAMSAR